MDTHFSVIMPTYNQASFIRRAILSLQQQTYSYWELIIINDGCTDEVETFIFDFLEDERITYIKNKVNQGLGYALNQGLDAAKYDYIAYLPSDDFYFENHLESIKKKFEESKDIALVYTGTRYDTRDTQFNAQEIESKGVKKGFGMQLAQTAHRKVNERWVERSEWITDDLFVMYWRKLLTYGLFTMTHEISCYWTSHPFQRHLLVSEKFGGGLNRVRSFYHIQTPIKIRVSKEKFWDEKRIYANFRESIPENQDSLKILLVGELAYNPERVYALEQAGHKLCGLWIPHPYASFSTVGHLPFGHVEDLSPDTWEEEIVKLKPDIIYAMLNWESIDFSYEVMRKNPNIPFAWHFKEGPSASLRNGKWEKLIYLYTHATLKIYLNETAKKWFEQFIPQNGLSFVMDGDLPKSDYFKDDFSTKLSSLDGAVHTLIAGRMIGISDKDMETLADNDIHIHLYTENYHASRANQSTYFHRKFPKHFHIHPHCVPWNWTKEFSQYNAGWLHCFNSNNGGNLLKATWDDLNMPARLSTYMAAGLPIIQTDNSGNIVAMEECIHQLDVGVLFKDFQDLAAQLKNKKLMSALHTNALQHREKFCFDYYIPQLVSLFREAIKMKKNE